MAKLGRSTEASPVFSTSFNINQGFASDSCSLFVFTFFQMFDRFWVGTWIIMIN